MPTWSNEMFCTTENLNTGVPQCFYEIGLIEGVILVPKGTKITQTQVQTLQTTLQAACQGTGYFFPATSATEGARCYPIKRFVGIEDKSTDVTLTETPYKTVTKGVPGQFHWVFEYSNGGMYYDAALNTFSDAEGAYDMLILDKSTRSVIGVRPDYNTSGYVLQGISLDKIYCPLPKIASGEATKHYIGFVLSDYTELLGRISVVTLPAGQSISTFSGMRNIEMTTQGVLGPSAAAAAAGGGTTIYLRMTTDGGAIDLGTLYATEFTATTLKAQFTVKKVSDGTNYAVSNLTYNSATGVWTMTVATLPAATTEMIMTTPTVAQMVTGSVPGFGNASHRFILT
jgi:hypothetical protein